MEEKFIEQFRQDIHTTFKEKAQAFSRGELSRKDYKGISGGFGSYAQRDPQKNMLRLRCPGGRLTKEKLRFMVEQAEKYGVDLIKLTTCQTVQFHNLEAAVVPALMEEAMKVGIYTKGGGGDNPRNVMCSPLSGVEKGECFDCQPYAQAVTDYLLGISGEISMPRKLKVAFSNGASDRVHARFRDMGFVALPDGNFQVYIAGGLGALNPTKGLLVEEHAKPENLLRYVRAMVDTFIEHGNYQNRAKARTRFMQETLGEQGLKAAFFAHYDALEGKVPLLKVTPDPVQKAGAGAIAGPRILPQKQEGLFAVRWHPIGGVTQAKALRRLYEAVAPLDSVECRLSPDESLYIINLTAQQAQAVLDATPHGADHEFAHSKICIGAAICQQGVRDSQSAFAACLKAVDEAGVGNYLPRICISGCPSSCSAHQAGAIGLQGASKMVEKKAQPAFKLYLGGQDGPAAPQFGSELGTVLESELPALFVAIGRAVKQSGLSFAQWRRTQPEALGLLVQPYL